MAFKLLKSISLLTASILPLVTISCGEHIYHNVGSSFNSEGFNAPYLGGERMTTATADKLTITREIKNGDDAREAKENHFYVIMSFDFEDKDQEVTLHFDKSIHDDGDGYVYRENSQDMFSLEHEVENPEDHRGYSIEPLGEHDINATKFMMNATDDFIIYDTLIVVRQVEMSDNQSNDNYFLNVRDSEYLNIDNLIATKSISLNNTLLYKDGDVQKLDFYEV